MRPLRAYPKAWKAACHLLSGLRGFAGLDTENASDWEDTEDTDSVPDDEPSLLADDVYDDDDSDPASEPEAADEPPETMDALLRAREAREPCFMRALLRARLARLSLDRDRRALSRCDELALACLRVFFTPAMSWPTDSAGVSCPITRSCARRAASTRTAASVASLAPDNRDTRDARDARDVFEAREEWDARLFRRRLRFRMGCRCRS